MSKASEWVKNQPLVFKTKKGDVIAAVDKWQPEPKEGPRPMLNIKKAAKLFLEPDDALAFARWILDTFGDDAPRGPLERPKGATT